MSIVKKIAAVTAVFGYVAAAQAAEPDLPAESISVVQSPSVQDGIDHGIYNGYLMNSSGSIADKSPQYKHR